MVSNPMRELEGHARSRLAPSQQSSLDEYTYLNTRGFPSVPAAWASSAAAAIIVPSALDTAAVEAPAGVAAAATGVALAAAAAATVGPAVTLVAGVAGGALLLTTEVLRLASPPASCLYRASSLAVRAAAGRGATVTASRATTSAAARRARVPAMVDTQTPRLLHDHTVAVLERWG